MILSPKTCLLGKVRQSMWLRHFSLKMEKSRIYFTRDFILFHQKRHSNEMVVADIRTYRSHFAVDQQIAASTQDAAYRLARTV
ncbi:MAG: phage integrase N-terminal SAM-like domain-containing protein [Cyanobacteria bacterium P01_D01_bin.115]